MDDPDENSFLVPSSRRSSQATTAAFLDAPHGSFKGPNSLQNFANSFARSTSFAASKIDNDIHKKRSFLTPTTNGNEDNDDETFDPDLMIPSYRGERLSTIIHDLQNKNSLFMNNANELDDYLSSSNYNNEVFYHDDILNVLNDTRSRHNSSNIPGAIPIKNRKQRLHNAQSFSSLRSSISLTPSIISFKKIEDENGNSLTVLQGQSTAPQTIFNSVNVLIGVGLLALPSMMNLCGWILGLPILLICGLTTCWTATLLSKAMDTDETLMTYADLGYAAYGSKAKLIISVLFSIDLLGAGVSLIVLFSDSLFALFGNENWTKTKFKIISFFILTPFTFVPLSVLSIISLFGILSTISITLLIFICGLIKQDSPGSLIEFMPTNFYPSNWIEFLVGVSLAMAPFGGHAIFPNLKNDMRHPYKFTKTLKFTYFITILTDASMAIIGYLMYGNKNSNEITNTLLLTKGYPLWVYPLVSGLICLVPLAKTPLNAKPIISALNSLLLRKSTNVYKDMVNSLINFLIKIGVNLTFVLLAILFPEFDKILGMLGASICFIICNILPCLFYLKLCGDIKKLEKFIVYFTIIISIFIAIFATYAVIIY